MPKWRFALDLEVTCPPLHQLSNENLLKQSIFQFFMKDTNRRGRKVGSVRGLSNGGFQILILSQETLPQGGIEKVSQNLLKIGLLTHVAEYPKRLLRI